MIYVDVFFYFNVYFLMGFYDIFGEKIIIKLKLFKGGKFVVDLWILLVNLSEELVELIEGEFLFEIE